MLQLSDMNIVVAVKRGDFEAYEELFLRYYPVVRNFICGFVKEDELAKDLAQEVFMKMWQYRSSLDASKPVRAYLFLLARREVCSHFRAKAQRVNKFGEEAILNIADNTTQQQLDGNELSGVVSDILENMPPKRKEIFTLSRRMGLSNREIAERLDISVRTVDKHIELAIQDIRKRIER